MDFSNSFRQIIKRIFDESKEAIRVTAPSDPINNPDLYASIDDKPVLRTSPLNSTAILSVFIERFTEGLSYDSVLNTIDPNNDNIQKITFLDGDTVARELEIIYDNISWKIIRTPRTLITEDGIDLVTEDGQILTEE